MIPQNFSDAFERVKELVSIFSQNEERYLSPGYFEAQSRLDFIDKFWIALGWDVAHENQTDPYKQEVKVERGVATNEWRKRADYAFLSPNFRDVRFYVEAKKPHAGIDNPDFYFQTIRYGWNSHTPIAVLTDFEELRVLDCRYKPDIRTAIGHAVLKYHYTDYSDEQKFRTIYYLFSRESVLEGSIENFAKGLPKPSRKRALRGVAKDEHQDIDEAFLKELDEYREELARAFKRKNPELDSEALTEVTQRTLDRLVFMRFLEDKLIETEPLIENLHRRGNAWENFVATSRSLDRVYNGIIFKEHNLLDSPGFMADGRTFDKISQNLSHTNSPYDFNAIPIHILGSIYERFLGKVIVATAKQARVEEKPEVRKAGGVYYTPEYIVCYIVDNTVGKLIEAKTPEEIRQLRFADIACGSGSFLLGVYDTLLRYHTAYYNRNKRTQNEGRKAGCLPTEKGALRLSLLQRRDILLNNIYGVDIDPQAVEVAQLSLYLKLLEDETTASAHQMALRQALLPSLSERIVCGNSLIGWDILEGKLFDSGDERKLNPMNFEDAFPEVMKREGFDAIVGNPPYVLLQDEFRDDTQLRYFRRKYKVASYKLDTYHLFIERGILLTRAGGRCSMITPANYLTNNYLSNLRRFLLEEASIEELVVIDGGVFKGISVDNAIFVAEAGAKASATDTFPIVHCIPDDNKLRETGRKQIVIATALANPHVLFTGAGSTQESSQWQSIVSKSARLVDIAYVNFGKQLRDREKYTQDVIRVSNEARIPRTHTACYTGKNVTRYDVEWTHLACLNDEIARSGGCWDADKQNAKNKLLTRQIGRYPDFAIDRRGYQCLNTMFMINIFDPHYSPLFVLGILNSRLLRKYWLDHFYDQRRTFPKIKGTYLKQLPIYRIRSAEDNDKHNRIVQVVTQMLGAKKQLAEAQTERDKTFYENKCASLDRQIDNLVYELYDLTPEEIAIVEGAASK
ncbi:MAG: N-6 DNA methylase [Acidobacteriota bacterium]|nr:N-6 DNA methylase [Acidobacteriota bacterium]